MKTLSKVNFTIVLKIFSHESDVPFSSVSWASMALGRASRKAQRKAIEIMVVDLHHFLSVDPIMACSPNKLKVTS